MSFLKQFLYFLFGEVHELIRKCRAGKAIVVPAAHTIGHSEPTLMDKEGILTRGGVLTDLVST